MQAIARALGLFAALLAAAPLGAVERVSGDAYSLDGNQLLYHETHWLYAGGERRVVLYRCPDGRAFARKRVRPSGDAQAPDFDLVVAPLGYREGAHDRGAQREVYVQRRSDRPLLTDSVGVPPGGVIDAGFEAFAQRHWDALLRGDSVRFEYLVPSRRAFYHFKAYRIDAADMQHRMTVRIALGFWFSFLLPHVDMTWDVASRRIVRYEGLSNLRGADGRNLRVRTVFPTIATVHDVPQAEVDAALAAPLAPSCARADTRLSAAGQSAVPEVTAAASARNANP